MFDGQSDLAVDVPSEQVLMFFLQSQDTLHAG